MKKVTLLTIVTIVALTLATTANAAIVSPAPSSGGSGGGSSSPVHQYISSGTHVSADWNRFQYGMHSETRPEQTHSYEDGKGNYQEWTEPQHSNNSLYFTLEQGFMGKNYLPAGASTYFNERNYGYEDAKTFDVTIRYPMLAIENTVEWNDSPNANDSFNAFGINYSRNISLEHERDWVWNEKNEWIAIETNNIQGNFWLNFEDTEIRNASLGIEDWNYWNDGVEYPGMEIVGRFTLEYLGDYPEMIDSLIANQEFPGITISDETLSAMTITPEPATIGLLGLGALGLLRRR